MDGFGFGQRLFSKMFQSAQEAAAGKVSQRAILLKSRALARLVPIRLLTLFLPCLPMICRRTSNLWRATIREIQRHGQSGGQ
ncbi:MAG: hypothetical protein N2423_06010 [Novosphingobium sp.]|nr:hypothetical protein [Novosphingobium sp.]